MRKAASYLEFVLMLGVRYPRRLRMFYKYILPVRLFPYQPLKNILQFKTNVEKGCFDNWLAFSVMKIIRNSGDMTGIRLVIPDRVPMNSTCFGDILN